MPYLCHVCKRKWDLFEHPSQLFICANKHWICKDCKAAGNFACEKCRETKWHFERGTPATGTKILRCVKTEAETKGRDLPEVNAKQEVCKGSVEVEIQIDTVKHADAAKQNAAIVQKSLPEDCQVKNRYWPLKDSKVLLRLCSGAESAVDKDASDKKEIKRKSMRESADAMKNQDKLHEKESNGQENLAQQKCALNAATCFKESSDSDGHADDEAHALKWQTYFMEVLCELVDHVFCEQDTTATTQETDQDIVEHRDVATQNAKVSEKQKQKAGELGKQCCDTLKVKQVEVRSKAGDDKLKHENINDRKVENGVKSEINEIKADLLEKCLAAMKELNKFTEKETKAQLKTLASEKRDSNTVRCSKERSAHQKDVRTNEKESNKPSDVHTLDPGKIPRLELPAYYVTCMNCHATSVDSNRAFYGHSITVKCRNAATQCTEISQEKEACEMKKPLQEKQVLMLKKADAGTQKDNDAGNKNEILLKKGGAEEMAENSYNKCLGAIKKLVESKKELNESKKKLDKLPEKETNAQLKTLAQQEPALNTFDCFQESPDGGSDEIQINMLPKQELKNLNNSPANQVESLRLKFPPNPVKCPKCQDILFPTDFYQHVYYDHDDQGYIHAGVSRQFNLRLSILRGQKSICLNPYIFQFEQVETSLGQKLNKLPVFINIREAMSSDLIGLPSEEQQFKDKLYGYIMWVAMLVPCNHSFRATLAIWNLKHPESQLYISDSRTVQPISEWHDLKWQYENSFLLSMSLIESMAKDDNLKFEITINQ